MYPKTIEIERDALLGEVQAAKLLNLSTRTLQAWRIKGLWPSICQSWTRYPVPQKGS
jgi:hypothetical protein